MQKSEAVVRQVNMFYSFLLISLVLSPVLTPRSGLCLEGVCQHPTIPSRKQGFVLAGPCSSQWEHRKLNVCFDMIIRWLVQLM
jgi:hypothetical protein